jgi:hypothetical protein
MEIVEIMGAKKLRTLLRRGYIMLSIKQSGESNKESQYFPPIAIADFVEGDS